MQGYEHSSYLSRQRVRHKAGRFGKHAGERSAWVRLNRTENDGVNRALVPVELSRSVGKETLQLRVEAL